jgi:hypothetical protein
MPAGPMRITWWELVHERAETWTLTDYRLAARLLSQLAARRRAGAQVNRALPAAARDAHDGGSALRFYASRPVFGGMLPVLQSGQVWQHPILQDAPGRARAQAAEWTGAFRRLL